MKPVIEITYVLRSGQGKALLPLENALLRVLDAAALAAQDYKLELHTAVAPVDQSVEERLILSVTERAWIHIGVADLLRVAVSFDAMLFIRRLTLPATKAVVYKPSRGGNAVEIQYLARNYGKGADTIFISPYSGDVEPEILKAFYEWQDKDDVISPELVQDATLTVDLTNEETKKLVKNSLGIRNPACELTAITVDPDTSEVTYTVKSALWGEKEHKVICNDINNWPLRLS